MATSFPPVSDGGRVLYFDGCFRVREQVDADDPGLVHYLIATLDDAGNVIETESYECKACCLHALADMIELSTGGEEDHDDDMGCVVNGWN